MTNFNAMSLQDLGKYKTDALARLNALEATAKAESRDLNDEEFAEFESTTENLSTVAGIIETRNSRAAVFTKAKAFAADGSTNNATRSIAAPSISGVKDRVQDDPKKGFKSHVEYFKAIIDNPNPRTCKNEGLNYLSTAGSDEHSGSNDAFGGYLIPEGLMPGLMTVDAEEDFIAGRVQAVPMATPVVHINARTDKDHTSSVSGGLRVYRRAETNDVASSRMQTEQIRLGAESLMGISYATEELLQDSPISVAALVSAGFQQEFGSKLINERLNGTGVGQFEGIANCPALVTVAKESGQAADTLTYNNLLNMFARMWRPSQAIWICNQTCIPQLGVLNQTVGTAGVPAWQPSAREGLPSTIFGQPVFFTEYCEALGDLGDIYFANWSQYLEGTYRPMESAESVHVRFVENERAFRFTMRNDARSWWRSALTPKKGVTLSPFVTLAARA